MKSQEELLTAIVKEGAKQHQEALNQDATVQPTISPTLLHLTTATHKRNLRALKQDLLKREALKVNPKVNPPKAKK